MRRSARCIALVGYFFVLVACAGYRTTVVPRLTVMEEVTDNVFLSSSDPQTDVITSVTPGVTIATTGPTASSSLSYDSTIRDYYETGTKLATLHAVSFNAEKRFSRYSRVALMDTFSYIDDPLTERDPRFTEADGADLPPSETFRRTDVLPFYMNTVNMRFNHDFAPDSSAFFNYTNSILQNDDPTVENNLRNEPSIGLTYWLNPRYGIETRAIYTRADFNLESDPFNEYQWILRFMRRLTRNLDVFMEYRDTVMKMEGTDPDYCVYDWTAGVDYHPSRTTYLALSGGYFYRDQFESSRGGYVVRADMAKEFSRGRVRLSGGTGYRLTVGGEENLGFTEFKEVSAVGEYEFTRRLSGEATASYAINQYNDAAGREDTPLTLGAGLSYRWNPWVLTRVHLAHRSVDSNTPGESYDENRVMFSISVIPPRPYILK